MSSRVLGGRGRWAGCRPKRSSRDVDLLRMAEGSCTEASPRDFLVVSRTPSASATPFLDVRRLFWGPKVTFGDSHTQVRAPKIIKKYESLPLGTLPCAMRGFPLYPCGDDADDQVDDDDDDDDDHDDDDDDDGDGDGDDDGDGDGKDKPYVGGSG